MRGHIDMGHDPEVPIGDELPRTELPLSHPEFCGCGPTGEGSAARAIGAGVNAGRKLTLWQRAGSRVIGGQFSAGGDSWWRTPWPSTREACPAARRAATDRRAGPRLPDARRGSFARCERRFGARSPR